MCACIYPSFLGCRTGKKEGGGRRRDGGEQVRNYIIEGYHKRDEPEHAGSIQGKPKWRETEGGHKTGGQMQASGQPQAIKK